MILRTTRHACHVMGYLLAGCVVVPGLVAWRLAAGPIELTFLTPYLGQTLDTALASVSLHSRIESTIVTFGGFGHPLELRLRDVQVNAADGHQVASIPELGVGLSLRALVLGRPVLDRLSAIRPTLHLERTADGRLILNLNGPEADATAHRVEMAPEPVRELSLVTSILDSLRGQPDPLTPIGALSQISVTGAALTLDDRMAGVTWSIPRADLIANRTADGANAQLRLELDQGGRIAVIEAGGNERRSDGNGPGAAGATLKVDRLDLGALGTVIPRLAPLAGSTLPVSGNLEASFDGAFQPLRFHGTLAAAGPGTLILPTIRPEPVQLAALSLEATMDAGGDGYAALEHARIDLSEPALSVTASGRSQDIFTTPAGSLTVAIERGARTGSLEARLAPAAAGSTLTLQLRDLEPALFAGLAPALQPLAAVAMPVGGTVTVALDQGGEAVRAAFDLAAGPGRLTPPAKLLPEAMQVQGITLRAEVDRPFAPVPAALDIKALAVDFGGPGLELTGTLTRAAERVLIKGGLKAHTVRADSLPRLWPLSVGKPARDWVTQRITAGMVDRAWLSVDGWAPLADPSEIVATTLDAGLDASNLTVNYFKTLAPIVGANGHAVSDGRSFSLTTTGGHILDLAAGDARIVISKLDTPQEWIDIDAPMAGSMRSTLTVLDTPPLRYAHKVAIDPANTEGSQTSRLHFVFPLRRNLELPDVAIHVDGALHGAAVQGIAGGINADQGELKLVLDNAGMDVTGTARIEGIPSSLQWRENFSDAADPGTRLLVKAEVGEAELAARGLHPAPYVGGSFGADIQLLIDRRKRITVATSLNLARARLALPELGWNKPADTAGSARFSLDFDKGRPVRLANIVVDAAGLKLAGAADLNPESHALDRLTLSEIRTGGTDAQADIKLRPDGGWDIDVRGPALDVSAALKSPDDPAEKRRRRAEAVARRAEAHPPGARFDLSLRLGRLMTGEDGRAFTDVAGTLGNDGLGWDTVRLTARVAGAPESLLSVSYLPEGAKRRLEVTSSDFGAVLRALDLTDSVRGGTLHLTGLGDPGIPAHPLGMQIDLGEFRVIRAPLLARIINALSVTGLLELLQGEGLTFTQAAGDMTWGEGLLALDNVRTSGGALGLTIGGKLDLAAGSLAVEGTIVPLYGLNRIVGLIPVLGDLLSGGAGQGIFAATYYLDGALDEPGITVNPLAALAPGFLRNLFFLK